MKKPSILYWVVAGLGFIWNLLGVAAYIGQALMDDAQIIAANGEEVGAMIINQPAWYTAVFAVAVFAGALGCLGLLLRQKWALILLGLSLLCVIIQNIYFALSGAFAYVHGGQWIMTLLIPIIAIFLVGFARHHSQQGTLR